MPIAGTPRARAARDALREVDTSKRGLPRLAAHAVRWAARLKVPTTFRATPTKSPEPIASTANPRPSASSKVCACGFAVIRTSHPSATSASTDFGARSEEHTSELQSRFDLVCRLLLEKKKKKIIKITCKQQHLKPLTHFQPVQFSTIVLPEHMRRYLALLKSNPYKRRHRYRSYFQHCT